MFINQEYRKKIQNAIFVDKSKLGNDNTKNENAVRHFFKLNITNYQLVLPTESCTNILFTP